MDDLEEAVREHGVSSIAEVDLAILEVDGNVSVLSNEFHKATVRRRKSHKALTKEQWSVLHNLRMKIYDLRMTMYEWRYTNDDVRMTMYE